MAGLSAAASLLESRPNASLLVLEAKDRVGGRTHSVALPCGRTDRGDAGADTDWWDLGGQWVGDCQPRVCRLADQLGVERFKQFNEGRKLLQLKDGRVGDYTGELPSIGLLGNLDLVQTIYRFEAMLPSAAAPTPRAAAPPNTLAELTAKQAALDGRTMEAESAGLCWSGTVQSMIGSTIRILCGQEPEATSALYMTRMCHSAGGLQPLISSKPTGAQGYRLVGGAQSLSLRLADQLGEQRLRLNAPVCGVDFAESGRPDRSLVVSLANGEQLIARLVIFAVPPNQLARLSLPREPIALRIQAAAAAALPSHYAKFIVIYADAWWRRLGYSGELFSCDPGSPIVAGFDGVTKSGSAALVLLSAGRPCQDLECLPTLEARRDAVLSHLARFFPAEASVSARGCLHFAEKFWRAEPFNGGCPADVTPCGFGRLHLASLAAQAAVSGGRLLFAGTEFAREWVGYMEGAVESGQSAAAAASQILGEAGQAESETQD